MASRSVDDLLMQEIQAQREQLRILTEILSHYAPDEDMTAIRHSLGHGDGDEYRSDLIEQLRADKRQLVEALDKQHRMLVDTRLLLASARGDAVIQHVSGSCPVCALIKEHGGTSESK